MSTGDLEDVTHKVYFDVDIGGKPSGMFLLFAQFTNLGDDQLSLEAQNVASISFWFM